MLGPLARRGEHGDEQQGVAGGGRLHGDRGVGGGVFHELTIAGRTVKAICNLYMDLHYESSPYEFQRSITRGKSTFRPGKQ